jgi:thiol-disulfide isomerase/thioredoxin
MELVHTLIVLGNNERNTEIAIITSPFCGYCKDAHEIMDKILNVNKEKIKIKILINVDIDRLDDENKIFLRSLISIYLEKGESSFLEALSYWFKNKNIKDWLAIYKTNFDSNKIDSIYRMQNQWCIDNNSYLTPSLFINGYRYPKTFKRENLDFFVNDLIEDIDF